MFNHYWQVDVSTRALLVEELKQALDSSLA